MTENEKKDLATRLADGSRFVSYESALRLVEFKPAEAKRLIGEREECATRQAKRGRILRQLHLAARELI